MNRECRVVLSVEIRFRSKPHDRTAEMAAVLVLEPIFEAELQPEQRLPISKTLASAVLLDSR
jgi:hypothetical protein